MDSLCCNSKPSTAKVVVFIEGNINSGKSTLLSRLKEQQQQQQESETMEVMPELFSDCDLLAKRYAEPEKYSYAFQKHVLQCYKTQYERAVKLAGARFVVIERSVDSTINVFCKNLLSKNLLTKDQFEELEQEANEIRSVLADSAAPIAIKRVFLSSSVELCKERVDSGNKFARQIDGELLRQIDNLHSEWLEQLAASPTTRIGSSTRLHNYCSKTNAKHNSQTDAGIVGEAKPLCEEEVFLLENTAQDKGKRNADQIMSMLSKEAKACNVL